MFLKNQTVVSISKYFYYNVAVTIEILLISGRI